MKVLDAKNEAELAEFLLGSDPRHPRTARVVERLQRFIGGLDDSQRTVFLEAFLVAAWENRHSFNAQYEQLLQYVDRCAGIAALTRDRWLVSIATMPGVYERRWVLGRRLGKH